jgi:hypothetical protein
VLERVRTFDARNWLVQNISNIIVLKDCMLLMTNDAGGVFSHILPQPCVPECQIFCEVYSINVAAVGISSRLFLGLALLRPETCLFFGY